MQSEQGMNEFSMDVVHLDGSIFYPQIYSEKEKWSHVVSSQTSKTSRGKVSLLWWSPLSFSVALATSMVVTQVKCL